LKRSLDVASVKLEDSFIGDDRDSSRLPTNQLTKKVAGLSAEIATDADIVAVLLPFEANAQALQFGFRLLRLPAKRRDQLPQILLAKKANGRDNVGVRRAHSFFVVTVLTPATT
jgi:hypothetical protein